MPTVQSSSNEVSANLLASVNGTKNDAKNSIETTQDRFMTLLVTQMKNQDPLNPLDNAQVTSQLAQLSTVTGIDKMNNTLETFMANMQSSQSLQMSNLIGHDVLVEGNEISFDGTGGYFGVELPANTDDLTITINDAAGNQIRQLTFGNQTEGILPLSWDGFGDDGTQVGAGDYTFTVSANTSGEPAIATALSLTQINSISTNGTGIKLNLGNASSVTSADLKQIF
ncbi:MAG: flagellar hook assembly protein FlgD [Methylophilaceae bacterium]